MEITVLQFVLFQVQLLQNYLHQKASYYDPLEEISDGEIIEIKYP